MWELISSDHRNPFRTSEDRTPILRGRPHHHRHHLLQAHRALALRLFPFCRRRHRGCHRHHHRPLKFREDLCFSQLQRRFQNVRWTSLCVVKAWVGAAMVAVGALTARLSTMSRHARLSVSSCAHCRLSEPCSSTSYWRCCCCQTRCAFSRAVVSSSSEADKRGA
jgi:hypothetical protein